MIRIRIILLLLLFLFSPLNLNAQTNRFSYSLGSSAGYITPGQVPFWLRSNQFGSVPIDNASLSLFGAIHKDYNKSRTRIFDWGASVVGRANLGDKSNLTLIEGYAKVRISIFEIRAGRSKEIMGLCDTSLTSGDWAVSGNALGIPRAFPETAQAPEVKLVSQRPIISFDRPALISNMLMRTLA